MKLQKALVSLTVATLAMTSAAGCTGSGSSAGSSPSSKETAASNPPADLTVEIFDRGNTPDGGGSVTDNYLTKWIAENVKKDLNINLKFYSVPRAQEIDKLNVLMSSGSAPDIIFTFYQNVYFNYAKQGGLYDLTALVDKYGGTYKQVAGDRIKAGQFEGKQMALVSLLPNTALWGSFIRKDWLDKLNLPMPTTRDEWYNDLKAFKEKDPGGVGSGIIPFGMYPSTTINLDNQYGASSILWSFVKDDTPSADRQSLPYFMLPGWKDGVRFVNKMYNEGLIDPEFAIDQNMTKLKANISSGKVGAFSQNYNFPYTAANGNLNDTLAKNIPGASMVPVDPFKNDAGKYPKVSNPPVGLYIMVPKTSKNPEAAVKYLNWLADQERAKFLANGKEGEHYKVTDGVRTEIDPAKNQKELWVKGDINLIGWQETIDSQYKNIEKNNGSNGPLLVQVMKQAMKDGIIDYSRTPVFDRSIESIQKYKTALDKIYLEGLVKAIMCKPEEFDKNYDAMAAEYLKNGGQAMIDEKKQYFASKNK